MKIDQHDETAQQLEVMRRTATFWARIAMNTATRLTDALQRGAALDTRLKNERQLATAVVHHARLVIKDPDFAGGPLRDLATALQRYDALAHDEPRTDDQIPKKRAPTEIGSLEGKSGFGRDILIANLRSRRI